MAANDKSGSNRRAAARRSPKRTTQVICYANALGLGPNIAVALLDVSESGARLKVKVPIELNKEIEINLTGIGHRQPLKVIGQVVWCVPIEGGSHAIGVKFVRYLPYRDLLELGD